MTETKTSRPGVDWTKLLTDPDIISHLAELLQAYREAEPSRRDQVLRRPCAILKARRKRHRHLSRLLPSRKLPTRPQPRHLLSLTFSLLAGVRIGGAIRE